MTPVGVLDPPGHAGVLTLHAHGALAFLQITGLAHDQHRVLTTQVFHRASRTSSRETTQARTPGHGAAAPPARTGPRPGHAPHRISPASPHQARSQTPAGVRSAVCRELRWAFS